MQNFGLHLFLFPDSVHFPVWTPDFGWTPRLNYTLIHWCPRCPDIPSFCPCDVHLYADTPRIYSL